MSIQLITEIDGITINEILKDDITIYDYIKKVIEVLGEEANIIMIITIEDKMITLKIK